MMAAFVVFALVFVPFFGTAAALAALIERAPGLADKLVRWMEGDRCWKTE